MISTLVARRTAQSRWAVLKSILDISCWVVGDIAQRFRSIMRRCLWLHGDFMLGVVVRRWLSVTWTKVEELIVRSLFLGGGGRVGGG